MSFLKCLKCLFLLNSILFSKLGFAFNYRILILPSGGATGIISTTALVELEQRTGKRVHEHFHEIWASSIGAMIASQLTVSSNERSAPKSALEVQHFLEQVFSSYWRASGILKEFKNSIPIGSKLKDTIIPVRILSAEVKSWMYGGYVPVPSKTELKSFCPQESGNVPLRSLACASCAVPPIHWYEPVVLENGETSYHLDAGHEFCTTPCMNPMFHMIKEFSKNMNPEQDTLSLFFLSNGWVRLHPSWGTQNWVNIPGANGRSVPVNLFNLDVDLSPVIAEWKRETWHGHILGRINNEYALLNLAGIGAIQLSTLKKHAENVLKDSSVLSAMIENLIDNKQ